MAKISKTADRNKQLYLAVAWLKGRNVRVLTAYGIEVSGIFSTFINAYDQEIPCVILDKNSRSERLYEIWPDTVKSIKIL